MTRRHWVIVALVLSLGVNLGLVGAAWLRHRAPGREAPQFDPGAEPGLRLADRLELEGGTRERFLALQRELVETARELRPRIARLERELRVELVAERPERQRIDSVRDQLGQASQELDRAFVENVLATREVLDGDAERAYLRFVERFPSARRALGSDRDSRRRLESWRNRRDAPPPGPGDREPPQR